MKKLFKEFSDFINKGNALALAIGVIIGAAFTAIVTSINQQIISPLIGYLLGGYNLTESEALMTVLKSHTEIVDGVETLIIDNAIYWGALIQSVLDFLLTAVVLFTIFKVVTLVKEAAHRAAERLQEAINLDELLERKNKDEEETVEETPVVEEAPVVVEEVKPSDEVLLLTEIRDLLSKINNKEE